VKGYDHLTLRVSDVDKAAGFFQKMFGLSVTRKSDVAWVSDGDLKLILRKVGAGETPGIDSYAIRTPPFDRARVASGLKALGATVDTQHAQKNVLRFADPDGLKVELVTV
jgi:metallothiol transferase